VQIGAAGTSVTEGDSGTTEATFTVSLSQAATGPVSVDYATADGSALASEDYQATSGSLTFPAGTQTLKVPVMIVGDASMENDEQFAIVLSNANGGTIGTAEAFALIQNDDFPPPPIAGCDPDAGDVCGTDGSDELTISSADDLDADGSVKVVAGGGNDRICVEASAGLLVEIRGGKGDDTATVGDCGAAGSAAGASRLYFLGGAGSDRAFGGSGRDVLRGGVGLDFLAGRRGADLLYGARGNDVLRGGYGNDALYGGAGRDSLYGGKGYDTTSSGPGHDELIRGSEA
jgi:serralysin